jgi:hypothetical protein
MKRMKSENDKNDLHRLRLDGRGLTPVAGGVNGPARLRVDIVQPPDRYIVTSWWRNDL